MEGPFAAVGVVPALVGGPAPELSDRLAVPAESVSDGCSLSSPAETSRVRGDAWTGEADFLLAVSLPPRDEFRGETLPVCKHGGNMVSTDFVKK